MLTSYKPSEAKLSRYDDNAAIASHDNNSFASAVTKVFNGKDHLNQFVYVSRKNI